MNARELIQAIQGICESQESCDTCPLNRAVSGICGLGDINWDAVLDAVLER